MKLQESSSLQGSNSTFNHRTYIDENGVVLYDMPIEADTIKNLEDFGATPDDFVTIKLGGIDRVRVLFVKTPNRELAEYQWSYLTEEHNRKMRESRCMVPGKWGGWVICNKNNDCRHCPFGKKPEEKQCNTVSWNALIEKGYEPETGVPVETQVIRKIEMEEVRAMMDAKDPRIWKAFSMKEIFGESVDTIKDELGVSAARVYQLVAEAHTIGRQYRKDNP